MSYFSRKLWKLIHLLSWYLLPQWWKGPAWSFSAAWQVTCSVVVSSNIQGGERCCITFRLSSSPGSSRLWTLAAAEVQKLNWESASVWQWGWYHTSEQFLFCSSFSQFAGIFPQFLSLYYAATLAGICAKWCKISTSDDTCQNTVRQVLCEQQVIFLKSVFRTILHS